MHLFKFLLGICKSYCTKSVSLRGRSFLESADLTVNEIKSLLWTAIEIKTLHEADKFKVKSVRDKFVCLLSQVDKIEWTSLSAAANLLDVRCDKVIRPKFESTFHDRAHFIEGNVDMAFLQLNRDSIITKHRKELKRPLISIKNSSTLIDLMSIQLAFGRLEDIEFAYIGEPCPLVNCFIRIFPRLGVKLKICCLGPSGPVTAKAIGEMKNRTDIRPDQIVEVSEDYEALEKSDVILVRPVGMKDLDDADVNYIIESEQEGIVDKTSIDRPSDHEKSFKKKSINTAENAKYVYAALMLRFLADYEHVTPMPQFAKQDNPEILRTVSDNKDKCVGIARTEETSETTKVHVVRRRYLKKEAKPATRLKIFGFRKV